MATGRAAFLLGYHWSILIRVAHTKRLCIPMAHELAPADIVNGFRQRRMLHHRLHPQTLHADRLALTDQASREFVQEVSAAVRM